MRMRGVASAAMTTLLLLAASGCGGDTSEPAGSAKVKVVRWSQMEGARPPQPSIDTTRPPLRPGDAVVLGPDEDGASAKVTLRDVSYPKGKTWDRPSGDRVLVALEMEIRNIGRGEIYGTNAYPDFVTSDGRLVKDTGWVVAAFGKYGTDPGYEEELPDTIGPGQDAKGWSLYAVPPKAGELIFGYGPEQFRVSVDPTLR